MTGLLEALLERLGSGLPQVGLLLSGTFLGFGGVIVAQVEAPLDLVGGSILLTAGVVALRMVLSAAKFERAAAHENETRLLRRIIDLEEDLDRERRDHLATDKALTLERRLRLALETEIATAGRPLRHDPSDDVETPGGVTPAR